jgi:hypothetical protein
MARLLTTADLVADEPMFINGRTGCIYLVTNTVTGQRYVGQTTYSMHERWRHHVRSRNEVGDGLGDAVGRFGQRAFSIVELVRTDRLTELDALEQFYIEQYETLAPNGYNLTPGGKAFRRTARNCERISYSKIDLRLVDSTKPCSRAGTGKRARPAAKCKPVIGTHLVTGEVIHLPAVSAHPNFDPRLVSACCRGKRRHHRGYAWRYAT